MPQRRSRHEISHNGNIYCQNILPLSARLYKRAYDGVCRSKKNIKLHALNVHEYEMFVVAVERCLRFDIFSISPSPLSAENPQ